MSEEVKKGWLKRIWTAYSDFCKEAGVDQGTCRGCVPVVRFDEDSEPKEKTAEENKNTH